MADTLCIYHQSCPDGYAAMWAVRKALGERAEYLPAVYQQDPPDVTGKDVVLVDFSYKRPVIEKMLETAKSITILDHHDSALDELSDLLAAGRIQGILDKEYSGAVLAWKWFHGHKRDWRWLGLRKQPVPRALQHIGDFDTFQFRLPNTRAIQRYFTSYPYDFDLWDKMIAQCENPFTRWQIILQGEAICRQADNDLAETLKVSVREIVIGGHRVQVANVPHFMATNAGQVLSKGVLFAATYCDTVNGRKFSLRSDRDGSNFNVSAIAKQYGGGGHWNAAGFTLGYDALDYVPFVDEKTTAA